MHVVFVALTNTSGLSPCEGTGRPLRLELPGDRTAHEEEVCCLSCT